VARILIIDDEEAMRLTIRHMLETAGHDVATAIDGGDGVRRFRQQPAELVLCDVFMPHQAGIATFKEVHGIDPEVPVIVMSEGAPRRLHDARHAPMEPPRPSRSRLGAMN
jgi:two-component system, chemotaxis family, chemotaxis protein CheY